MKTYSSEIDFWLISLLTAISLPLFLSLCVHWDWVVLVAVVCCLVIPLDLFTGTKYVIDDHTLYVKSGHLFKKHYNVDDIIEITKTNSFESSPALSMNRIRLVMRNHKYIILSPKKQKEFIQQILDVNPNIKVDERL